MVVPIYSFIRNLDRKKMCVCARTHVSQSLSSRVLKDEYMLLEILKEYCYCNLRSRGDTTLGLKNKVCQE